MSTTAKDLLVVMSARFDMQTRGVTHPSLEVRAVTQQLVEKLRKLAPDELIDIKIHAGEAFAQYIRSATGEVLAGIRWSNQSDSVQGPSEK